MAKIGDMPMSFSSLGLTVALLTLVFVGLVYLVDVNRYKSKIVDLLKKHTGRTFQIQDRMHFTFIPWAGMNLGKVRIGNAQGFEEKDFVDIQSVKVRVKVLPLFAMRVVVDTVRLDGMDVNLARNADGVTNWDDLLKLVQQFVEPQETPDSESENKKPKKRLPSLSNIKLDQLPINPEKMKILGLDIKNLNLTFEDHVTHAVFRMTDLKMKTSAISLNQPFQVQLSTTAGARNLKVMEGLAFDSEMDIETKVTVRIEKSIPTESLPAQ
jgi:AsmA protein